MLSKYAELLSIYVQSGGASPTLQSRTVTPSSSQQTIYPQSGYDALSSVIVNGDSNLVSNNIKKGTSIFGITGNYPSSTNANTKRYSFPTTTTSKSCYFKIPSTINPVSIAGLQLNRFQTSDQNYQLHVEDSFSKYMLQRILAAFLGLNTQSEDNTLIFTIDGYFLDRTNSSIFKYFYASVGRFWGTSTHYGVTNIITFNKDSDGGISVNIPNWSPQANIINNDGSKNYTYSSVTYPYWSTVTIYCYEIN